MLGNPLLKLNMEYDFVLNLVNEQIIEISGPSSIKQIFFSSNFCHINFLILVGMIPYNFTMTNHFVIILGLSLFILIGITTVGFQIHGLHFFSFLLPQGISLSLAPFLVILKLMSYLIFVH